VHKVADSHPALSYTRLTGVEHNVVNANDHEFAFVGSS